jgi:hypothetical protein
MTGIALALLVGSVAAFAHTEQLKLERSPVGRAQLDDWFSPVCDCPQETTTIAFELRERERLDVTVVDGDGTTVRRLETGARRSPGPVEVTWDGRDQAGRIVPDGGYRIHIRLRDERRTIVIPETVNVDTQAPEVSFWRVSETVLFPGRTIGITFEANEPGRPVLLLDGERAWHGPQRRAGTRIVRWDGTTDTGRLPPGAYRVALAFEDRAGNRSQPTGALTVIVAQVSFESS